MSRVLSISPWICWFSLMQIEKLDQTYSPFNGGWLHGDDLRWDGIRLPSRSMKNDVNHGTSQIIPNPAGMVFPNHGKIRKKQIQV